MLKIWDLAKKSHFASVLATDAAYANFLHTMMNYIENGIHHQFLKKNVDGISHPTASTTVKSQVRVAKRKESQQQKMPEKKTRGKNPR